jgi:hypothetical protein
MLIATSILGASILAFAALVLLKAWEARRGAKVLSLLRDKTGQGLDLRLAALKENLPNTARRYGRRGARIARAYLSFAAAKLLMTFERLLERVLRRVRHAPRDLERKGEASVFLREVAAYKRMLAREEEDGAVGTSKEGK